MVYLQMFEKNKSFQNGISCESGPKLRLPAIQFQGNDFDFALLMHLQQLHLAILAVHVP